MKLTDKQQQYLKDLINKASDDYAEMLKKQAEFLDKMSIVIEIINRDQKETGTKKDPQ